ncbi:MAG: hypothetical protein IJ650_00555 [Paludibacteraceae bacterium]|nr:hypothetical protein [Paludibacteraceae bacterium]
MRKILKYIPLLMLALAGCKPEAKWSADDNRVKIDMCVDVVSAGYVECSFSTNREAYYFVAIDQARDDFNPIDHQKQFMMLALDSANVEYLSWRNKLLKKGEFNVAPFASHSLQYGDTKRFFTGLQPDTDYWIYSFIINPETLQPVGKLHLMKVHTTDESIIDIHFEYRIKGLWDYIYPVDTFGNINDDYPYIFTFCDSLDIDTAYSDVDEVAPHMTLLEWMYDQFNNPKQAEVHFGVTATENNGITSNNFFKEGHTYYTGICGFDGLFTQATIYKFKWNGDSTDYYFYDIDSANIMNELFSVGEGDE